VVLLLVKISQVKLVVTNKRVFEETLVHQLDADLGFLQIFDLLVFWLEEEMLVPNSDIGISNILLSLGKLALTQAIDLHDGVYLVFSPDE